MNKIYKVVWCHIRNTYVVASELARGNKKVSGGSLIKKVLASSVILGSLLVGAQAIADPVNSPETPETEEPIVGPGSGENSIVVGDSAEASAKNAIAVGSLAKSSAENAVALGVESKASAKMLSQ